MIEFHSPWFLLLLVVPLAAAVLHWRRPAAWLAFTSLKHLRRRRQTLLVRTAALPNALAALGLALCIAALARPRKGKEETVVRSEGVDIVLTVDVSGSMTAHDFRIDGRPADRLAAVKTVIRDFVARRPDDRIGLVAFASRAYTVCPLTLDHGWLLELLEQLKIRMIEDGTAIGSAIGTSVNRLRESTAKSRIAVLLTDGSNNAGEITPEDAAAAARALGVKVYTIAAGQSDYAPVPAQDPFGQLTFVRQYLPIEMESLRRIAQTTGAQAYRATDTENLRNIYGEIDRLERSEFEMRRYLDYRELFAPPLFAGLGLLFLAEIMRRTLWEVIPA